MNFIKTLSLILLACNMHTLSMEDRLSESYLIPREVVMMDVATIKSLFQEFVTKTIEDPSKAPHFYFNMSRVEYYEFPRSSVSRNEPHSQLTLEGSDNETLDLSTNKTEPDFSLCEPSGNNKRIIGQPSIREIYNRCEISNDALDDILSCDQTLRAMNQKKRFDIVSIIRQISLHDNRTHTFVTPHFELPSKTDFIEGYTTILAMLNRAEEGIIQPLRNNHTQLVKMLEVTAKERHFFVDVAIDSSHQTIWLFSKSGEPFIIHPAHTQTPDIINFLITDSPRYRSLFFIKPIDDPKTPHLMPWAN